MSKTKKDSLGDRMKSQYEDRTRFFLPRRTYTVLRLDGKAFHTWTKGLRRPFDKDFHVCMNEAALAVCEEMAGVKVAYLQSDEISLLLTDFEKTDTQSWFDGNLQKMVSVAASTATMAFNRQVSRFKSLIQRPGYFEVASDHPLFKKEPDAIFDGRVFTIPDPTEVYNYFVWRQKDAERNSIMMLARTYASHKELHGKSQSGQHDVIHAAGDNWNSQPTEFKRGRAIYHVKEIDKPHGPERISGIYSKNWLVDNEIPVFTKDSDFVKKFIPIVN